MGRKKKEPTLTIKKMTKVFIEQHAIALKDFGGEKTKKEYIRILSQYKDNPTKFDFVYSSMRDELLNFN